MVSPRPAGYPAVCPYLIVADAAAAIEFYRNIFGGAEVMRLGTPDGQIMHAEVRIGDALVMVADEMPQWGFFGPQDGQTPPVSLMIYVDDAEAVTAAAVAAGSVIERELTTHFYGDRSATIRDPFGHHWTISTHVEDVDPEELARRFDQFLSQA